MGRVLACFLWFVGGSVRARRDRLGPRQRTLRSCRPDEVCAAHNPTRRAGQQGRRRQLRKLPCPSQVYNSFIFNNIAAFGG
jgi:hypothetical protein